MALKERGEIFDCKCEGRNPNCQKCEGKGYYYKISDSKKPQSKISIPSDPFPLTSNSSSDEGNENSYVKRHLEKYASYLEQRRKKKEKREEAERKNREAAKVKQLKKREAEEEQLRKRKENVEKEQGKIRKRKRID